MALNTNEFGELVRAYRKQRGYTQAELAEHWGHSRVYVSLIEVGNLKGMQLASEYRSRRHVLWLDKTYKQLKERAIGSDKRLLTLRDAPDEKQHEIESW